MRAHLRMLLIMARLLPSTCTDWKVLIHLFRALSRGDESGFYLTTGSKHHSVACNPRQQGQPGAWRTARDATPPKAPASMQRHKADNAHLGLADAPE
jgi:hypothetical protein